MSLYICSLKRDPDQSIPPNTYELLRFPFGSAESLDKHGMHQMAQPDGYQIGSWDYDERSGLIWPKVAGWATITGMIYWRGGSATKFVDRVIRDPLGFTTTHPMDTTATEYRHPFDGSSPYHKTHQMAVEPGVPLGLQVRHNGDSDQAVYLAEFKVAIDTDVAEA